MGWRDVAHSLLVSLHVLHDNLNAFIVTKVDKLCVK